MMADSLISIRPGNGSCISGCTWEDRHPRAGLRASIERAIIILIIFLGIVRRRFAESHKSKYFDGSSMWMSKGIELYQIEESKDYSELAF